MADAIGRLVEVRLTDDGGAQYRTVYGTLIDMDEERGITLAGAFAHAREKLQPLSGMTVRFRPSAVSCVTVISTGTRVW